MGTTDAMTTFEWIAIIGAAAWIPHVLTWLYHWLVKPELTLVVATRPEIGYSTYGPVLNLNCAISAARKSALIEKITVILTHQRGQSCELTWVTLNETLSQARSTSGEVAEYTKSQVAIALKVDTSTLAEKLIGFNDLNFLTEKDKLVNKLVDVDNHLRKMEDGERISKLLRSKELSDVFSHYEKSMYWQEGNYTARVLIHISGLAEPFEKHLSFTLSADDIERISKNIDVVINILSETVHEIDKEKRSPEHWNWANPPISSL